MSTLRHGAHGADVATLQRRLTAAGFAADTDGIYGDATEAAVRRFQASRGLVTDGIAGARTQITMLGGTSINALTQADIESAADKLGCDVAAVQAIVEVESGANGYLPDGRVKILFERHIMWRQLKAAGIDPAPWAAQYPGIVNTQPGGYHGGAAEYVRLATAKTINAECAVCSASWGRFQIMGEHWQSLGYASAQAFAAAMQSSEGAQLHAFVAFVQRDSTMHEALKAHDWPAFAAQYNGPAYARNLYDVKLQRAYARHAGTAAPADTPVADAPNKPRRARKASAPEAAPQ